MSCSVGCIYQKVLLALKPPSPMIHYINYAASAKCSNKFILKSYTLVVLEKVIARDETTIRAYFHRDMIDAVPLNISALFRELHKQVE